MNIVKISSKNQITLPVRLLNDLGVKANDKLLLEKKEDVLVVKPITISIVDELAGSLNKYIKPEKLGKPFSEIRKETQKIVARKLALETLKK